jgi:hypothetical protein
LCILTAPEQKWLVASVIARHVGDRQLRTELGEVTSALQANVTLDDVV